MVAGRDVEAVTRSPHSWSGGPPQLLADLQAVGFEVGSVGDLAATRSSYRAAVPLLIDWLSTLEQRGMPLADVNK